MSPHESIQEERDTYQENLYSPDPAWPPDVRALYKAIQARLFERDLRVGDVRRSCGIGDHNVSCRFKYHVGMSPKRFVLHHRFKLAKHLLLKHRDLAIAHIGYSVGFSSASALTKVFKRETGKTPAQYRKNARDRER